MINFKHAVLCALLVFVGSAVISQEIPSESRKGKEHRTRKAGGVQSASAMGDGSVHFVGKAEGTHSTGSGTVAGVHSKTGKKGARLSSRHPGGAN